MPAPKLLSCLLISILLHVPSRAYADNSIVLEHEGKEWNCLEPKDALSLTLQAELSGSQHALIEALKLTVHTSTRALAVERELVLAERARGDDFKSRLAEVAEESIMGEPEFWAAVGGVLVTGVVLGFALGNGNVTVVK